MYKNICLRMGVHVCEKELPLKPPSVPHQRPFSNRVENVKYYNGKYRRWLECPRDASAGCKPRWSNTEAHTHTHKRSERQQTHTCKHAEV